MQVASLELSRTLYELSGWESDEWYDHGNTSELCTTEDVNAGDNPRSDYTPAYDLGYLLRKLDGWDLKLERFNQFDRWSVFADDEGKYRGDADTPEDAACKLAIELFKQGVLTKGES